MKSFPFESINVGTEESPEWDRAISAEEERLYNKISYTNGIFTSPVDGLMVSALNGMEIKVNPGGCHIEGAKAYESNIRTIRLESASGTLPRIDRIVCRFNTEESMRNIEIYKKEGIPATLPTAEDIIRQSNYYEIVLADIFIPAQAKEITNTHITDQRFNPELCGMVVPAIPFENQTAELWKQIRDSIDLVNSALDETVAGNLQAQITENALHANLETLKVNSIDYTITDSEYDELVKILGAYPYEC